MENIALIGIDLGLSGGAGEPPPYAPTEPYVTVSRHTALVAEPFSSYRPSASVQTTSDTLGGYAATTGMHGTDWLCRIKASSDNMLFFLMMLPVHVFDPKCLPATALSRRYHRPVCALVSGL